MFVNAFYGVNNEKEFGIAKWNIIIDILSNTAVRKFVNIINIIIIIFYMSSRYNLSSLS